MFRNYVVTALRDMERNPLYTDHDPRPGGSVRKAMGAATRDVVMLLLWPFTIPVLLGAAIALPIGLLAVTWWLRSFVYHAPLSAWTFVLAAGAAVVVAWLTVSYQSFTVARAKPAGGPAIRMSKGAAHMSKAVRAVLITLVAGLIPATASAEAPPAASATATPPSPAESTSVSGITVEAPSKEKQKEFRAHVDAYVHGQARPGIGPIKQITRWGDPVCPSTQGLTQAMNDFVSKRIEAVAERVGAPGKPLCGSANVLVLFTTKPQQLMDDVRDHHARFLGYHYVGETKALARFEPPIKSWYVTSTWVKSLFRNQDPDKILDRTYVPTPFCVDQSGCRIPPPLESRFDLALVVIQADRIVGKPIGAVADEIAMTVLSRPGPRQGCSPLPSVMDVLDPACPDSGSVAGLTPYDEAFLRALYAPHETELLAAERGDIERAVQAVGQPAQNSQ